MIELIECLGTEGSKHGRQKLLDRASNLFARWTTASCGLPLQRTVQNGSQKNKMIGKSAESLLKTSRRSTANNCGQLVVDNCLKE